MKLSAANSSVIQSVKKFEVQSETNFSLQPETQFENLLTDLYQKYDDEPDFDCEFLWASNDRSENESTIDPESEDDLTDQFDDNQWDVAIYDPYLESTYY